MGARQFVSKSKVRAAIFFVATAFILTFAIVGASMTTVTVGSGIEPAYASGSGDCTGVSFKKLNKSSLTGGNNFVKEVSMQTEAGSSVIGIDYAIVENDDGNSYYKSRNGANPSQMHLVKGNMVKISLGDKDLTNIDQIRSVTLYKTGMSKCSILLGNVDSSDMIAFEKVGDDQFVVPIADYTAEEFGKVIVQVEGNDEFEEFYITSPHSLKIDG